MAQVPAISRALKERVQVAAIDFGTTYSGYAFSFRSDFLQDPLNISANQWRAGSGRTVSLKTPTCILFDPRQQFHSFGFEAEDKYADLAVDGEHSDWFFFKRFKMLLYENKELSRTIQLKDNTGKTMSAMTVFTECIRFLKEHMIASLIDRRCGLDVEEDVYWILTVPAIWDDTAKQFMREAAINAGIHTECLSLALEPEAASLFCKYLPVNKVEATHGGSISCFSPGTRYLVLDCGGGTVDITVHETQRDQTVRELYKANGGPWGGTRIDETFFSFLTEIIGLDTMEVFQKNHTDDYLELLREFEIKKGTLTPDVDQKITFKIPLSLHETYSTINGQDLRRSVLTKQDLKDKLTFTGDKLRIEANQIKSLFTETCNQIVSHLKDVFSEMAVNGTNVILMVGGFSESKILQHSIKREFPDKSIVIPAEAGLAVLKGAVIFGHNPKAITSRVSRYTYGIAVCRDFDPEVHQDAKKVFIDGIANCNNCFDKHVEIGEEVEVGMKFGEKSYYPVSANASQMRLKIYTSEDNTPLYVDEIGCSNLGNLVVDLSNIERYDEKQVLVQMMYGDTELGLEARVVKTGQVLNANFDFLG